MEIKKAKTANTSKRSTTFYLVGLNIALLLALGLFEFTQISQSKSEKIENEIPEITEEEVFIVAEVIPEPIEIEQPTIIPPPILQDVEQVEDSKIIKDPVDIPDNNKPIVRQPNIGNKKPNKVIKPSKPIINRGKVKQTVNKPLTRRNAKHAPVYPGCEKYKGDNKKLYNCFNKSFNEDLSASIDNDMQEGDAVKALKVKFEIDKNGNLKPTKILPGNNVEPAFIAKVENAFKKLTKSLERKARKGKKLQPAIDNTNKSAVMEYSITVKFAPPQ